MTSLPQCLTLAQVTKLERLPEETRVVGWGDYAPELQDPGDGDMFGAFADAVEQATGREICRDVDCGEPASTLVTYPSIVSSLGYITHPYCEAHAEEIMGNWFAFPGAHRGPE